MHCKYSFYTYDIIDGSHSLYQVIRTCNNIFNVFYPSLLLAVARDKICNENNYTNFKISCMLPILLISIIKYKDENNVTYDKMSYKLWLLSIISTIIRKKTVLIRKAILEMHIITKSTNLYI